MRPRIVFILTIGLSLFTNVMSFAQSVSDTKGPPPPNIENRPPGGAQLPVDDNIYILILFGLLLGGYFIVKKYRSNDIPA